MISQTEGVVTLKNKKGELIAIIYKDGANAPVIYMTEVAAVDELVELIATEKNFTDENI